MSVSGSIGISEILYKCLKCNHEFIYDRFFLDYGRDLRCEICAKPYIVDCFKDEIFEFCQNLAIKKFPGYKNKATDAPERIWFELEFEKTCDPCECGGSLSFSRGELYLKCPHCKAENPEFIRLSKTYSPRKEDIKWVTHHHWEKTHGTPQKDK